MMSDIHSMTDRELVVLSGVCFKRGLLDARRGILISPHNLMAWLDTPMPNICIMYALYRTYTAGHTISRETNKVDQASAPIDNEFADVLRYIMATCGCGKQSCSGITTPENCEVKRLMKLQYNAKS